LDQLDHDKCLQEVDTLHLLIKFFEHTEWF